ncbi:efflux RND transporter permease subunit [Dongia soli]|uniref:Multidrug efflux RND transporter permease subunit n=1 Tax=Dongia soli TaxID=600628 RepID=A0ABU5EHM2_9PROT|nr:multidrug efflux RND transporter permease subunit [Dongia soli]MDY0885544.1 multidrug efflux RND transporter permease subunit [Dongia soli]
MTLPELCIRRPVMTTLLMITFVVIGIFGYRLLPVAALPRVDFPTIQVSASLPGASPETMAASVATPLERQFMTIAGINTITSTSTQGSTDIQLQFDLNRDIDGAALDVQSAMTTAARQLPEEMTTPPSFRKVNPADSPILFLSLTSDTLPLSAVDEYAETLIAQRISTLPGIAQVQVYGAQKFSVRVQLNPNTLAGMGVGFDDIQNAVNAANSNTPVGSLSGTDRSAVIQANQQLTEAAQYRPLIVAYRNGNPVRLGDIANVVDSVENDKTASWFNGRRTILLAIRRQPDANTVAVVDAVKEMLPYLNAQIPASVKLNVMLDRSESIRASVADVQFTLALTIALVVLVIFLFLRNLTATLIPAVVLPVSLVGTFALMYLMGYSIDNLSLLALTLSVGFVVDDAIVMLENIVRHIEEGEKPWTAAMKGSREIAFTILSITLSLVAVFIPVLFMGGIVGRLFREFAVTISLTILISGFVSLTLTPMMCSRLLRAGGHNTQHGRLYRFFEAGFDAMHRLYDVTLSAALRIKPIVLLITLASLGLTFYLMSVVQKGFFPIEDTGQISITTEGPEDISFAGMTVVQQQAAAIIAADPAVSTVNSSVGSSSAGGENSGRMFVGLKPLEERKVSVSDVINRLRPKLSHLPSLKVYMQPVQNIQVGGRSSKSLYQVTMQGTDLDELNKTAPEFEKRLAALPGLRDVTSDLQIRSPQIFVDIDRDRAALLGITTDQIRSTLYGAFGSRQIATIYQPSNDYEVILEVLPEFRQNEQTLSSIYIHSSTGQLVPLDSLVTIHRKAGPLSVNHQSQLPSVTVSFNLAPGISLGQAVDSINQVKTDMKLPPTITTSFQGTAQVFQDSLAGQGLLLLAAIFVIYVVLGILYESFIHPITILSGLPAACLGALITLMLFKTDLNVISIIGIVMLIGIVKKNAIMMVDVAIVHQRDKGISAEQAMREACLLRFRPIMMTTMAAIMGTLPIALGHGAGAELRRPLGLAVVGGLVVSQLLTLYITPVIYIYFEKLSRMFKRQRSGELVHPAE